MSNSTAAPEPFKSSTLSPPSWQTFLATLFEDINTGDIYCRAISPEGATIGASVPIGQLAGVAQFMQKHRKQHRYVGVATRKDASSGKLENSDRLTALFVDIDFKTTPEPEARTLLAAFPYPPTMVVASGGGLHVYWILRTPFDLKTEEGIAAARDAL